MAPTKLITAAVLSLAATTINAAPHTKNSPVSNIWEQAVSSIELPPSTLPAPTNLELLYIAVGLGTQNYTCTGGAAVSDGALATLYDATTLMVNAHDTRPHVNNRLEKNLACLVDASNSAAPMPVLGKHFFTSALVPSFDLYSAGMFLSASKQASANASSTACKGRNGQTAVAWLMLHTDGTSANQGPLQQVYRVETAGGNPPSSACTGKADGTIVTSDYSAEYWFYI